MGSRIFDDGCGNMANGKVAVAGTFNILHEGHKALLDHEMWNADELYIGITSDEMASKDRDKVVPFYLRKKAIEKYLLSKNEVATIFEINDIYGPEEIMDQIDILVVSDETKSNGELVSRMREKRGIKPLKLSVVSLVTRKDGKKLNASDILNGSISRDGKEDVITISVGSTNPVKVEAVREVMESIFGSVRIYSENVKSGVPEQPFEDETYQGALNRAKAALKDRDLSVGIEAGVFDKYGELMDIQYCVIIDKKGRITFGTGSGFNYPPSIVENVKKGMTVGEAVDKIYGKNAVGHSEGAIGILSKGMLDRKELTKQSILAAMIPRM